jgi:hypothetical protein
MGFPMASNLRKRIPKECTLYVNDVDSIVVEKFVKEHASYGPVKVLRTAREITEYSVFGKLVPWLIAGYNFLDCAKGNRRQERILG